MTDPDPAAVHAMFGQIAPRYDLANRLLSLGRDRCWRRKLVAAVCRTAPDSVLDLATGSGDVALALGRALSPAASVLGVDFCPPMLAEAERKKAAAGPAGARVRFEVGDALALPFSEASFDAVTIAFGLRNLPQRPRALSELRRILRPGGTLFVLEFSQPGRVFRPAYGFYLRRILPRIAGWLTGKRGAYEYLNATIAAWPAREALGAEILAAGFSRVTARALTGGIVALHEAQR